MRACENGPMAQSNTYTRPCLSAAVCSGGANASPGNQLARWDCHRSSLDVSYYGMSTAFAAQRPACQAAYVVLITVVHFLFYASSSVETFRLPSVSSVNLGVHWSTQLRYVTLCRHDWQLRHRCIGQQPSAGHPWAYRASPAKALPRFVLMSMGDYDGNESTSQRQLPTVLQLHVLALLPPNDRTLSGRMVCRDAFYALSTESCTASLGLPLPPHAVPWAVEAGQQYVLQLPLKHKLQLLSAASASGSEVNLEVVWAVLQPSIFPEMLLSHSSKWCERMSLLDPGVEAIRAGHPQVLGWLLQHCPALLRPSDVLQAAARHCHLAGLQAVWEALQRHGFSKSRSPRLGQEVLDAAAESAAHDTAAKMEWLLGAAGSECRLQQSTALAATRSGDLGRLQWLQGRGCALDGEWMLSRALRYADLAVAQWLVDQAGCRLPEAEPGRYYPWSGLLRASAMGRDGVAKLQWLQERGAPLVQSADRDDLRGFVYMAVEGGQVEVVRYLVSVYGSEELLHGPQDAFASAAARLCPQAAESLHQMGLPLWCEVYGPAARAGNLEMFRWLAQERIAAAWLVSVGDPVLNWPDTTAAHSRDMLEAVQLLAGAEAMVSECNVRQGLGRAAARGSLATVRYLLGLHQPAHWPDAKAVDDAVAAGCEELVVWMAGQPGGLVGQERLSPYIIAGRNGDRATLTALRRLDVPWGQGADQLLAHAVREGCAVPVLRWLVEQGASTGSRGFLRCNVHLQEGPGGLSREDAAWLLRLHPAEF